MLDRRFCSTLFLALFPALAGANADDTIPVMIVGVYHMSNPGRDIHNVKADDVLAPKRQDEIAATVAALERFKPTQVDVEWPAELVKQRYPVYALGKSLPSRNEVVQLGFRLAQASGAAVNGVDVDGDFPYEAVQAYAKAHGQQSILDATDTAADELTKDQQAVMTTGTVSQILRWLNEPEQISRSFDFYRSLLRVGAGNEQPGADLLTAWSKRNFYICANIVQHAKPGDRVVVFFGSGHGTLLRRCVTDTAGLKLVEAGEYLPK